MQGGHLANTTDTRTARGTGAHCGGARRRTDGLSDEAIQTRTSVPSPTAAVGKQMLDDRHLQLAARRRQLCPRKALLDDCGQNTASGTGRVAERVLNKDVCCRQSLYPSPVGIARADRTAHLFMSLRVNRLVYSSNEQM